jgi:hypothetical protein
MRVSKTYTHPVASLTILLWRSRRFSDDRATVSAIQSCIPKIWRVKSGAGPVNGGRREKAVFGG